METFCALWLFSLDDRTIAIGFTELCNSIGRRTSFAFICNIQKLCLTVCNLLHLFCILTTSQIVISNVISISFKPLPPCRYQTV